MEWEDRKICAKKERRTSKTEQDIVHLFLEHAFRLLAAYRAVQPRGWHGPLPIRPALHVRVSIYIYTYIYIGLQATAIKIL